MTRLTTPMLSDSCHLITALSPPPMVELPSGASKRTVGGVVSGGPTFTWKFPGLVDETGRFTPSRTVTLIRPNGVGKDGIFQSKLLAAPSSTAMLVKVVPPSPEKSTRWLCRPFALPAFQVIWRLLPTRKLSPPTG